MGKPGTFKKINRQDATITPFKVFKSWRYDDTASLDSSGIDRLVAIKPNRTVYTGNVVTLETWQRELDSGSLLVNVNNNKEASVIWYSLNHLYYKRAGVPFDTFGYADPAAIERTLFDEASVISVPQRFFGEQIKPGSVKLHLKNSQLNSVSMSLYDDGKGNLIDATLSSSISNEILYLGFNTSTYEKFYANSLSGASINRNDIDTFYVDTILPEFNVSGKNVWVVPNSNLYPGPISWGNMAYFSGSGYLRMPNTREINFKRSEDFSISFWSYREPISTSNMYILSKRTTGVGSIYDNVTKRYTIGDIDGIQSQYPYDIYYRKNDGYLVCRSSDGSKISEVTASISSNQKNHILFQKTGSNIELYVNGTFMNSKTLSAGNTQNNADVFIGSLGITKNGAVRNSLKGGLDDFFMFSKALSQSEITQLSYTGSLNLMTTNTNAVGNVFYEHGMIVLSDPRPKYGTAQYRMFNDKVYNYLTSQSGSGYLDQLYLEYNSTVTLYEHEYVCKLKEDEFNFSANPSLRLDNDPNSDIPNSYVANENFSPYITTVGLYNNNGELLAIGKLATPIKKRDNVDLAIIVRFDA